MTDQSISTLEGCEQLLPHLVRRPRYQLRSLPVPYRWEATRRHPYYLMSWRRAQAHYRQDETHDPVEPLLRLFAIIHLAAIGVSDLPPDPGTEFDQLESENLNPAWLSGAIHPISLRGLANLLIAALPKETLTHVGMLLVEAGLEEKEEAAPQRIQAMFNLMTLDKPGLNNHPDEPIVSVNPAASGREVNEAVNALVKEWKEQRELTEQRTRADKYPDYFRVWDMREAWIGDSYDPQQERKLKEVAFELGSSIATVNHHYRRAFELILGHPYSPELWFQVVAPLKLSALLTPEPGRVSRTRPSKTPTRRPVPESNLTRPDDGLGIASSQAGGLTPDAAASIERIRDLLAQGLTNKEIVECLDMSENAIRAVDYLRERGEGPL